MDPMSGLHNQPHSSLQLEHQSSPPSRGLTFTPVSTPVRTVGNRVGNDMRTPVPFSPAWNPLVTKLTIGGGALIGFITIPLICLSAVTKDRPEKDSSPIYHF